MDVDEGDDDDGGLSSEVMSRHYNALIKELRKSKPNVLVVNTYLNKEFLSRRNWLRITPADYRCEKFCKIYTCFKNHVEVNIVPS